MEVVRTNGYVTYNEEEINKIQEAHDILIEMRNFIHSNDSLKIAGRCFEYEDIDNCAFLLDMISKNGKKKMEIY